MDPTTRRGSLEPTAKKAVERSTTPDIPLKKNPTETVTRSGQKKSSQDSCADSTPTQDKHSTKTAAAAAVVKTETGKKVAVSPKPDPATVVKSEAGESQKKPKALVVTEKQEKPAATTSAVAGKRIAPPPAAPVGHPAAGSDTSSSSPSLARKTTGVAGTSPAPLVTRKSGPTPSPVQLEGNSSKKQPAKLQDKSASGESSKSQKSSKSPVPECKKSANNLFAKPSPKTGATNKLTLTKSTTTPVSKANKILAHKSSQGKGGPKAGTAPVQPLTVNLRAKKDAKERAICMVCDVGNRRNEKLIFCKQCDKIGKFPPEFVLRLDFTVIQRVFWILNRVDLHFGKK